MVFKNSIMSPVLDIVRILQSLSNPSNSVSLIKDLHPFTMDLPNRRQEFSNEELQDMGFLHTEAAENGHYKMTYPYVYSPPLPPKLNGRYKLTRTSGCIPCSSVNNGISAMTRLGQT